MSGSAPLQRLFQRLSQVVSCWQTFGCILTDYLASSSWSWKTSPSRTKQPRKRAAARSWWGRWDISIETVSSYQIRSISISKGSFLLCFVFLHLPKIWSHMSEISIPAYKAWRATTLASQSWKAFCDRLQCPEFLVGSSSAVSYKTFFLQFVWFATTFVFLCFPMSSQRLGVREQCSLQCGWRACLMLSLMERWGVVVKHMCFEAALTNNT